MPARRQELDNKPLPFVSLLADSLCIDGKALSSPVHFLLPLRVLSQFAVILFDAFTHTMALHLLRLTAVTGESMLMLPSTPVFHTLVSPSAFVVAFLLSNVAAWYGNCAVVPPGTVLNVVQIPRQMKQTAPGPNPQYELSSGDVPKNAVWPYPNTRLRAWIITSGKDFGYHMKIEVEESGTVEIFHGKFVVQFVNGDKRVVRQFYISDFDECIFKPAKSDLYPNVGTEMSRPMTVSFYQYT